MASSAYSIMSNSSSSLSALPTAYTPQTADGTMYPHNFTSTKLYNATASRATKLSSSSWLSTTSTSTPIKPRSLNTTTTISTTRHTTILPYIYIPPHNSTLNCTTSKYPDNSTIPSTTATPSSSIGDNDVYKISDPSESSATVTISIPSRKGYRRTIFASNYTISSSKSSKPVKNGRATPASIVKLLNIPKPAAIAEPRAADKVDATLAVEAPTIPEPTVAENPPATQETKLAPEKIDTSPTVENSLIPEPTAIQKITTTLETKVGVRIATTLATVTAALEQFTTKTSEIIVETTSSVPSSVGAFTVMIGVIGSIILTTVEWVLRTVVVLFILFMLSFCIPGLRPIRRGFMAARPRKSRGLFNIDSDEERDVGRYSGPKMKV